MQPDERLIRLLGGLEQGWSKKGVWIEDFNPESFTVEQNIELHCWNI